MDQLVLYDLISYYLIMINLSEIYFVKQKKYSDRIIQCVGACRALLVSSQGEVIPPDSLALVETLIEPWFIFALVWSVGGTCDGDGRKKFSEFLRKKIDEAKVGVGC